MYIYSYVSACQQRLLKAFLHPGYLRSEDMIV